MPLHSHAACCVQLREGKLSPAFAKLLRDAEKHLKPLIDQWGGRIMGALPHRGSPGETAAKDVSTAQDVSSEALQGSQRHQESAESGGASAVTVAASHAEAAPYVAAGRGSGRDAVAEAHSVADHSSAADAANRHAVRQVAPQLAVVSVRPSGMLLVSSSRDRPSRSTAPRQTLRAAQVATAPHSERARHMILSHAAWLPLACAPFHAYHSVLQQMS
jgi:hypothetical protein